MVTNNSIFIVNIMSSCRPRHTYIDRAANKSHSPRTTRLSRLWCTRHFGSTDVMSQAPENCWRPWTSKQKKKGEAINRSTLCAAILTLVLVTTKAMTGAMYLTMITGWLWSRWPSRKSNFCTRPCWQVFLWCIILSYSLWRTSGSRLT